MSIAKSKRPLLVIRIGELVVILVLSGHLAHRAVSENGFVIPPQLPIALRELMRYAS